MCAEFAKDNMERLQQWAGELACPACGCGLRMEQAAMVCVGCGRAYPVVDGIPVLIVDRALNPAGEGKLREQESERS